MRVVDPWAAAAVALCALAACGEAREIAGRSSSACASCHTSPGEAPPFRDAAGATDPALRSVGAHDRHLHTLRAAIDCGACHPVPGAVTDPGHLDDRGTADVVFGPLASARGATPVWSGTTCATSYCHGSFPGGNAGNAPVWLAQRDESAACGTCHALPPPTGEHAKHVLEEDVACTRCHGDVLPATHVDGAVSFAVAYDRAARTCTSSCHGADEGAW